jgi:excisionase family DNA binding protein
MNASDENAELLTIREAARRLRCSDGFVRKLIARGELSYIKDGRFVRVLADAVVAYLTRHANEMEFNVEFASVPPFTALRRWGDSDCLG